MIELADQTAWEITDPDGQAEDTARTIPNLFEGAKAWAVTLPR